MPQAKACPPPTPTVWTRRKGTDVIVVGIDPHMKAHTAVALDAATGRSVAEKTVTCTETGHEELLAWARRLDPARVFAIEDCRHVSGRLERHLLPAGERVVRVPAKMMAGARASARTYGKSNPIDAACVARVALREQGLPRALLSGPEHDDRRDPGADVPAGDRVCRAHARRGDEQSRGAQIPEAAHRQDAVQDDGTSREGARLSRCPRRLRAVCCRCRGAGLT